MNTGWSRTSSCEEVVCRAPAPAAKYSVGLAEVAADARVLFGEALDELLQALAGLRVERVEQLVEVDDFAAWREAGSVAPGVSAGLLLGPGESAM